ncbi:hypothetical protein [Frankia sp. CiP3]|uniref:hypothetical protein n=1 Tax=Frankia sp. CiP3 TaxID=2880971 RepID=UPI001EF550E3|nr:hypothetical protein [Frankia sp. CiP3]
MVHAHGISLDHGRWVAAAPGDARKILVFVPGRIWETAVTRLYWQTRRSCVG